MIISCRVADLLAKARPGSKPGKTVSRQTLNLLFQVRILVPEKFQKALAKQFCQGLFVWYSFLGGSGV